MKECEGLDTVVVCVLAGEVLQFSDNLAGRCHFCAVEVQHRPNIPTPHTLLCLRCFTARVEEGDEIGITPSTALDLMLLMADSHVCQHCEQVIADDAARHVTEDGAQLCDECHKGLSGQKKGAA